MTRNTMRKLKLGASAHRNDATRNSRTWPYRIVSQPVRGNEIALATANDVMTHVPWSGDTARSPEIAGIDTFAIDVSRTFMNVASDSAMLPNASAPSVSGGGGAEDCVGSFAMRTSR